MRRGNGRRGRWFLAVLVGIAAGSLVTAQQEMDETMQAIMAAAEPNDHHKHLSKLTGKWKVTSTMWMEPGAPPMESSGTATNEMILGGRFLQQQFGGSFMGMKFEGVGVDGYDNVQGKHIGTWMDSMGTMMMTFNGNCKEHGKVQTMYATFEDPASGQMMTFKGVTTIVSDDEYRFESYMGPEGSEPDFKNMVLVYKRM